MTIWSSLDAPRGVYTSPSFYVSNNMEKYIADISETLDNSHGQTVEYYYRISYNQFDWKEWKRLHITSQDLFDEYVLAGLYVQFKIVMVASNALTKPYLKSLRMALKPFGYVENIGDLPIEPKIWIRKKNGKGKVALINFTTGQRMEFKELNNGEELYIDCENEEIVSSNQNIGVYRYDGHNDEYLTLARGHNHITSDGDFDFDIRYKAKLLQE